MTDKELKDEIGWKRSLAESYQRIAVRSYNNPEQFSAAAQRLLIEAAELQKKLDSKGK